MAALYSHTTRVDGTTLDATIYNGDHQNHIDNGIPTQQDDYSTSVAQMKANADPGEVGTESLATTLAGELERLRFAIKEMKGTAQWYVSRALAGLGIANVFTANQTVSLTGLTPVFTISRPEIHGTGGTVCQLSMSGQDSAGATVEWARIAPLALDDTPGSEDGRLNFFTMLAGTVTPAMALEKGLAMEGATTGDPGPGKINATGFEINGVPLTQVTQISQANQAAIEAETNQNTYIPPDLIKHARGFAKMWCSVVRSTGLPVLDAETGEVYNTTSVTDDGAGNTIVTIGTDMSSAIFVPGANAVDDGHQASAHSLAVSAFDVQVLVASTGAAADTIDFTCWAFGDQA